MRTFYGLVKIENIFATNTPWLSKNTNTIALRQESVKSVKQTAIHMTAWQMSMNMKPFTS